MDFVRSISWKRLLLWWAALFVTLYASNFALYAVFVKTGADWMGLVLQASGPFCYGLFSFLYFRRVIAADWSHRLLATATWIGLSLIGSAILMTPIYGYHWTIAFSAGALAGQVPNAAIMLLVGFFTRRREKPELPEGLEM